MFDNVLPKPYQRNKFKLYDITSKHQSNNLDAI